MTSETPPLRPSMSGSRLLRVAGRFPLATFLILGFTLAYALAFIWGLAYHGVIPGGGLADALNIAPDELTGGAVVLSLFPAALFATWATSGRVGVRSLFRRAFHWRVNPGWWLTVLLGLPVLTVSLALLLGDQLRSIDVPSFLASQLMLLLVNFIVINLWEEVAWTGLFQTRLEERHNWLLAAVLTAIPFAAIHLPLQFFFDEPVTIASLAAAFGVYLVLGLLVRPMLAVFRRGTSDSLLLVGLLHSVFNRTNNENGIAATLLEGDGRQVAMLIAVVVLTVVTAVVIRSRLGRQYGAELAERSRTAAAIRTA
ncbi:MAG TPA: type II CAAX endopeptidase family protein [Propionibacteriaceae bacterium]|nr:type II CAAX endopeptidase family protein [Propionibacteriaceae bacterium]